MAPARKSLLDRAPIVDRLGNGLQKAWDRGWLPPIVLEPDVLIEKAIGNKLIETEGDGRKAEDNADFRERLAKICSAIDEEAQLNPIGRSFAYGQLTRAIRQRHELGKLWRGRPDILETELAPPIIVVGQMRAGTTRVHRLLSADPKHAATRFCDSWHPVPQSLDLRPFWSGMALFWARRLNPWIDTIHPFGAARPDEELGWLASALDHSAYEAQWNIPSYVAFSETRDPAPVYREFARILRTDALHHGNAHRPRVMKVPQFAEDLDSLLDQFPDARVVIAERDLQATIKSSISLVANQMAMQSDHIDLEQLHSEWKRKIALRSEQMTAALSKFTGPVAQVNFGQLEEDWEAAIGELYQALRLTLSDDALAAMRAEQRQAAKSDHRKHAEDLDRIAPTGPKSQFGG